MKRVLAVITAILVSILWLGMIVGLPVLAFTGQFGRLEPVLAPVQELIDQSGIDLESLTSILPAEILAYLPPTVVEGDPTVVVVETSTPTPELPTSTPTPLSPTETPTPEPTLAPTETPTPEDEVAETDLITETTAITDTGTITGTLDITTTVELTPTQELTTTVALTTTVPQTATVASIANVRSGPGTDFDIVGTIDADAVVSIVARDESGEWFQLEDDTWIFGILLAEVPDVPAAGATTEDSTPAATPIAAEEATPTAETPTVAQTQTVTTTVTADANLRSGPGTTYNVASGISAGSVITLAARNVLGTWFLLDTGNWVSATLLAATPEDLPIVNEQGVIVTGSNAGQSVLPQPTPTATPETTPIATPGATPVATESAPAAARPTTNVEANLRSGPGTTFNVVGSAPTGTTLDLVGRNAAGDWLRLADGSWIFAELVNNAPANLPVVTTP